MRMAPKDKRLLCLAALAVALKVKKSQKKSRLWSNQFLLEREEQAHGSFTNELRLEPSDLYGYLKIDQTAFFELLALVTPLIERLDTSMRKAITPHERLYATLLYLATGRSYMDLQFVTRISTQALGSLIPETCQAICKVLMKEYLMYPSSEEEWTSIAEGFEKKWQFPNCLGVVEGKHVRITPPPGSGTHYLNYKGFSSLVMIGLVNSNYEFISFDVDSKARTSEAEIFENTKFGISLIEETLPLPKERTPENGSNPLPYVFLGEEAFPIRYNFMKPFPIEDIRYEQLIYNYRLERVQSVTENTFGLMCDRFRIFHANINVSVHRAEQALITCAILHNFLRIKCPDSYSPDNCFYSEDTLKCEITQGIVPENNTVTELKKGQYEIDENTANETKYKFMNYFCNEGPLDWQCNMIVKNNIVENHFLFNDKE